MLYKKFIVLMILIILGILLNIIFAFVIPENPYKIIPTFTIFSFNKPLWLCIVLIFSTIYLIVGYLIYSKIKK